jgi:Ca2+-binding EF-hand superfamily protein
MKLPIRRLSLLLSSGTLLLSSAEGFMSPSHAVTFRSLPTETAATIAATRLSAAVATRQAVQAAGTTTDVASTSVKKKRKNKSSKKKSKRQVIEKDAEVTFAVIDLDGNGYISQDEFITHLSKAGYTLNDITKIFNTMDTNQDGQICFEEFRSAMISYQILQQAPALGRYNTEFVEQIYQDADQVFQSVDSDRNGFVDEFEFTSHLSRRRLFQEKLSWSEEAIKKIFNLLDVNKNRRISKPEFRNAFVRYSSLRFAIADGPTTK